MSLGTPAMLLLAFGAGFGAARYFDRQDGDSKPAGASSSTTNTIGTFVCGQDPNATAVDGHVRFQHERLSPSQQKARSESLLNLMRLRRSVRFISSAPVPLEVIERCVMTAATAPSGAHCQPWHFAIVSTQKVKDEIRRIVEEEEKINYAKRMNKDWVDELKPLFNKHSKATETQKEYLSAAPHLIVVFKMKYGIDKEGKRFEMRYPEESTGIAAGMLLTAIHNANLVTLTSTPMGAESKIRKLLNRPDNEKVSLLMPVGYPASDATVPFRAGEHNARKPDAEVLTRH